MLGFIFFLIFGVIISMIFLSVGFGIFEGEGFFAWVFNIVGFICIIVTLGYFIYGCTLPRDKVIVEEEIKIIAMKDNSNISGNFAGGMFLVSGRVGEETYYHYMKETNAGYIMEKVPADVSYIIETDEEPKIITKREEYSDEKSRKLLINHFDNFSATFYVPFGTIVQRYQVDLE